MHLFYMLFTTILLGVSISCRCNLYDTFYNLFLLDVGRSPSESWWIPPTISQRFTLVHIPLTITSLNAKGVNSPFKRAMLLKEAKLTKCDILYVQETHFHAQKPPSCQHKAFSHCFFTNAPQKRKGVFIAIHPLLVDTDVNGRYIIFTALIDNHEVTLVNLYAPNCHQTQFYSSLMPNAPSTS